MTLVNLSAFMADAAIREMTGKLDLRFPDPASSSSIKRQIAGNERRRSWRRESCSSPRMFSDWLGERAFD